MEVAAGGDEIAFEPRDPKYLKLLLWLLVSATFFEGYDGAILALLLADIQSTFAVSEATLGVIRIPIELGLAAAFFVARLADRWGRKPLLVWSVVGYTVFTALTAFSWDIWSFAFFQFASRVFLGAEYAVAGRSVHQRGSVRISAGGAGLARRDRARRRPGCAQKAVVTPCFCAHPGQVRAGWECGDEPWPDLARPASRPCPRGHHGAPAMLRRDATTTSAAHRFDDRIPTRPDRRERRATTHRCTSNPSANHPSGPRPGQGAVVRSRGSAARPINHTKHGGAGMATTTTTAWVPTAEEVRRIVAELRPVIDECVSRSHKFLDGCPAATSHQR